MGRKPENSKALTGAERQARYRARLVRMPAPPVRPIAQPRPLPRPQRWHAAVTALLAIREEYVAWYEAIPEATREGTTGEALLAMVELDLDALVEVQPPRGFGRD